MNKIDFENILSQPESSVLDFKRKLYDFKNDLSQEQTAKFIKDIISFANTVKTQTAYIIIGVGENPDNTKEFIGITENIDDAILQDKIKDKVYPRVVFKFYTIVYNNLIYGIIEIPVFKYSIPITPLIKLKGLEVGKVYYRRGSTNTEALGIDTININDWLKSLPDYSVIDNLDSEVTDLLKRTTELKENMSTVLADILKLSKKYKLNSLTEFATFELSGFHGREVENNPDNFKHRLQNILFTPKDHSLLLRSLDFNSIQIKNLLLEDKDTYKYNFLFVYSVSQIEEHLSSFKKKPEHLYAIITTSSKLISPKLDDYKIYCYCFEDTFKNLYQSIRQKIIDKLIEI